MLTGKTFQNYLIPMRGEINMIRHTHKAGFSCGSLFQKSTASIFYNSIPPSQQKSNRCQTENQIHKKYH